MLKPLLKAASRRAKLELVETPKPVPALADPDNVDSQIQPSDYKTLPDPEPEDEAELISLIETRLKAARAAQTAHHSEWFNAWSFYRGQQWRTWDSRQGAWRSMMATAGDMSYSDDFPRRYRTYNKIKPLVDKQLAKVSAKKPDASVSPQTGSAQDKAAVKEARAVIAHCDHLFKREKQMRDLAQWAAIAAAPCLKIFWNAQATADVPTALDDQGQAQDVKQAKVGEICEEVISPFEWMPDPQAMTWDKMAYVIHAQTVALSHVQERYAKGWDVRPNAQTADTAGIDSRMALAVGDNFRNAQGQKQGVLLVEMWEKKTARFPKGRLLTLANGVLLRYAEQWPDGDGTDFPFHPLHYNSCVGSVYGQNAVSSLVDGQILYNKGMSRVEEHVDESSWMILAPEGAELDMDAFRSDRLKTIVTYKPGFKPELAQTPSMPSHYGQMMAMADDFMRDNIGVHDVSDGTSPKNVDSGVAIQLLKEGDDTQLSEFLDNVDGLNAWRAEWEIKLAAAHYAEPRLIQAQDSQSDDPDAPAMEATTFQALGKGRVVVSPSSSTPKSPLLRVQQLMDMAAKGMFSPDNLPVTKLLLRALDVEESSKLNDDIEQVLADKQKQDAEAQAQAAQQQQAQAAQQQQAQAQFQQAAQQHEAEMVANKNHADILKMQAQAEIEMKKMAFERTLPPPVMATEVLNPFTQQQDEQQAAQDFQQVSPLTTQETFNQSR